MHVQVERTVAQRTWWSVVRSVVIGCLLALSACDTPRQHSAILAATTWPSSAGLKPGADHLRVSLRLGNKQAVPFVVDTGTSVTCVPTSVRAQLGKRLGTAIYVGWGTKEKTGLYGAPELYLEDTPLVTGDRFSVRNDNHVGLLGMDCLCHYCIQLDFAAGKIRFLDPDQVKAAKLGKPFPLTYDHGVPFITTRLFGKRRRRTMVDTGLDIDGALTDRQLRRAVREQKGRFVLWIEHGVVRGLHHGTATFPSFVSHGQTYTNFVLGSGSPDSIGLRFLARHAQVTFNFPKRMMYVSQRPNPNWKENLYHARQRH